MVTERLIVEFYKTSTRSWHWRLVASSPDNDSRIIAQSPSSAPTQLRAEKSFDSFCALMSQFTIDRVTRQ